MSTTTVPISVDCVAALELDWPEVHKRCRGNGALYLPGTCAPVLPQVPCGCACHKPAEPAS
ncbi:hypothetical protein ACIOC1_00480 [Streptomyces sp. NPDC088197]|uniref:hypothetical protein n=1 Tax=Streptomyces sp. NPDC088197 TaxID=3365840 RepID=UPI003801B719